MPSQSKQVADDLKDVIDAAAITGLTTRVSWLVRKELADGNPELVIKPNDLIKDFGNRDSPRHYQIIDLILRQKVPESIDPAKDEQVMIDETVDAMHELQDTIDALIEPPDAFKSSNCFAWNSSPEPRTTDLEELTDNRVAAVLSQFQFLR